MPDSSRRLAASNCRQVVVRATLVGIEDQGVGRDRQGDGHVAQDVQGGLGAAEVEAEVAAAGESDLIL